MRFDLAYCNQAVCAPSRNNLMLGKRSTSLGIYNLGTHFRRAEPNAVTLNQYFMRNGWRVEGAGKVFHIGHGNYDDTNSWSIPFQPGKVIEYVKPESAANGKLTREEAYFTNQKLNAIDTLEKGAAWEIADVPDNAYADGRIADFGIERLRKAKGQTNQPLFLALGFVKPHLPFTAPKKYWDLHKREDFQLASFQSPPTNAPRYAGKTYSEIDQYHSIPRRGPMEPELQRTLIHGYYAAASFMDAQIGRVMDELDRLDLAKNTIVILWSDHGWHLGDHGSWTKHTNYEQANRIALIISAPGVTKPGSQTKQLAETVDLYPTLTELAGLPKPHPPQGMDGMSLVPVLRDPNTAVKDHIYHAYPRQRAGQQIIGRAIRTSRYRLVEWKKPGDRAETADLELYDYQDDPLEKTNLATQKPEVLAQLLAILYKHPEAKAQVP
jgi:iduronate 2-sulfatase